MVAGLAFLSKKSWHVKNVANQERVWVAEQRKEQEQAKAKELAKQIQQEREQEELDKIAGKKSERIDRGIDWMYHGQQKSSEIAQQDAAKKSEEYLLGKAYLPEGGTVGDFDASSNIKEGVNAIIEAKKPPPMPQEDRSNKEPSVAERNEAFRHRHEDPMFAVAMEAKHKQDDYRKKKDLYERVVGVREENDYEDEKEHKRHRKEKKHKKKKKHHRRRHYSSDDESSEGDRHRHHHHDRKRHGRSRTPDSHRRRRSRSRDRDESSGRYRDRDDRHHRRRCRDDYSRDESYDRRTRRDRHDHYTHNRDEKRSYDTGRRRDDDEPYDRYDRRGSHSNSQDHSREKKPGYGLLGSSSLKRPPTDLGPDRELLRKKRQEREDQRERNRNQPTRRNMSEEEREAALRDMEENARQYQSRREERPEKEDSNPDPESSAAFLHHVARTAHGVTDGSMSLHERISQNRSTNQRLHEDFI